MSQAMYFLINTDISFSKEELSKATMQLTFDFLYSNYIKGYSNDKVLDKFIENKEIEIEYMPEEDILNLEEKGFILIRDKGLTQLKPNTLTSATKGIENGVFKVIINKDIKIGKGKLSGQVAHCVCSYLYFNYIKDSSIPNKETFIDYMEAQKKIILKCPSNLLLEKEENNTAYYKDNSLLAINYGIYDRDNDNIPKWLRELKLYSR